MGSGGTFNKISPRPATSRDGASWPVLRGWGARLAKQPLQGARFSSSGRQTQPDTNPSQLWLALKRAFRAELRKGAESKKTPLEACGVNPNLKP